LNFGHSNLPALRSPQGKIALNVDAMFFSLALSLLNRFGFSPEFPLPIQVVLSFLLTQTDRFVRTYKCNSPFDKVLCAIKTIIKSALQHLKSLSAGFDNFAFYTLIFAFSNCPSRIEIPVP